MRKSVIEMVLATDMKSHFSIHSNFQTKMQLNGLRSSSGGSDSKSKRNSPHNTNHDGTPKVIDEDEKSLVLQVTAHTLPVQCHTVPLTSSLFARDRELGIVGGYVYMMMMMI